MRREVTLPSQTITGKCTHNKWVATDGNERNMTLREAATLQTFPENFQFYGTKGRQAQQIGNAIPPLLAAHIISEASGVSFSKREEFFREED